jgi:hypothetical protein
MERRLNKKIEVYITKFKDDIREKCKELGSDSISNHLLQYIYDYERLVLNKDDFQKRKRVKNFVPIYDRCCAKRANDEQCTRRKKEGCEFCGTHVKGTPHGSVAATDDAEVTTKKVEVWAQDVQGIIYYIDKFNNVYQAEDVMSNKMNPKIIARYVKTGETYNIPEFSI